VYALDEVNRPMTQKVAVLGAGKIGEALLSGMLRGGWSPSNLLVTARR
jgi:pyrroline-5-carboxylate reductase